MRERQGNEIVPSGDPAQQDDPPQPKATHGHPNVHAHSSPEALERRESGQPGGGAGRRDDVGRSGVYPISGDERPSGDAELRPLGYWLAGDRDIEPYEDSVGAELAMRDGIGLGGLTSDGAGRPTIDIHGGAPEAGQSGEGTPRERRAADEAGDDERGARR